MMAACSNLPQKVVHVPGLLWHLSGNLVGSHRMLIGLKQKMPQLGNKQTPKPVNYPHLLSPLFHSPVTTEVETATKEQNQPQTGWL